MGSRAELHLHGDYFTNLNILGTICLNLAKKNMTMPSRSTWALFQLNEKAEKARGRRSSVCSALGYRHRWPPAHGEAALGTLSQSHLPPQSPLVPPLTLPALSCSSASDFICFPDSAYCDTSHFQALSKGYPRCGFCQGKHSNYNCSCVCSCSAAPTPQGRHPSHEYIQDTWTNENISSLEPNVNHALLKSTKIKYLPVLRELIPTCSLLDPKRFLSRSKDASCSHITLFWEKLFSQPEDKNMPFLLCLIFVTWRKTTQIKMPELRHYQEISKTRQSLLLTSYSLFSRHHSW